MGRAPAIVATLLALAVLAGAGAWFLLQREPPPPPPVAQAPSQPAKPSGPLHPPPAAATPVPLPPLDASDPSLRDSFAELLGAAAVERFLEIDGVVRRIVATVDNLPREEYAARYAPFIAMMDAVDTPRLAELYARHYPLFQQAYVELGYPNGHFNDRLVEVIDHLLAAPEPASAPRLAQPKVLYEYADPELESLSAGQKLLIRIGPRNEARVKAKLRELRSRIAGAAPG